jgi:glycosyltransferase involved in cell wall biosynthesis
MRIAMLCSNHPVTDDRVTCKQSASLARMGHDVIVFGYEGDFSTKIPGVTMHAVAPLRVGVRARLSMVPKVYREALAWKPDIITCHEPETAKAGLKLKKRIGGKVIFDAHEMWHETMSERFPKIFRSLTKSIFSAILRRIGGSVDWVTVVSPAGYDFYRATRTDGRVDMIENSPPMELFPQGNQDSSEPITILHDGFLSLQRGLLQMLEALSIVRRTRDIRFLIVGRIRPEAQPHFDQKVAELGLADIIVMPGWRPYEEIGKIESQAQIGLICHQYTPNSFLSLNNKLYNYMSCGQAIIGPAGSATADMIEKYKVGLSVDTTNPEKIADAIIKLAENLELRKQFGNNGRKAIETELGWHKMEERLERIYSQLEDELQVKL